MSIFRVSINIATAVHGLEALNEYTGAAATRWAPIGQPISTFDPTGPVREISQWHLDTRLADDTELLEPHLAALRPALERMGALPFEGVLYSSLSIGVNARENGFVFELEPEDAALLVRAGLRLRVDTYPPETAAG